MDGSPFNEDELAAQNLAGAGSTGGGIRDYMPDQHRTFFANLSYLAISTTDRQGWPTATFLTGPTGFIASPEATTLRIGLRPEAADPTSPFLFPGQEVGILGIDFATRRRNRANGRLISANADGITVAIHQSFGNCPKYIQRRNAEPISRAVGALEPLAILDASASKLIGAADTFFVATRSRPGIVQHGGADISHRGGKPGFVRIGGDCLLVPEFRGNRYYNTLGNLLGEPRAALLFLDFETGDLLHLQGEVEIDWSGGARVGFDGAEQAWRFRVAKGWWLRRAIPLRWMFLDRAPSTESTGAWQKAVNLP